MTSKVYWRQPLGWDRVAAVAGRPALVLCGSLCDVLEDRPDLAEPRTRLWDLIETTPNLLWMLLTKRIENAGLMWPAEWESIRTPTNVWLGVTAEDQARADQRIPYLLGRTAAVRFISVEPMLGPVDLRAWLGEGPLTVGGIGWVICGGESGPERREMDLAWASDLQAQCQVANVPFFMKQASALKPGKRGQIPDELWERAFPAAARREASASACAGSPGMPRRGARRGAGREGPMTVRPLRSITDTPAKCPACAWEGRAGECELDVDGDGSLGCPRCGTVVVCEGDSDPPQGD